MNEGFVVWITGLPCSGKTTISRILEDALKRRGLKVEVFDGDEVRRNLSPDLRFSKDAGETHVKRVAYMSKLLPRNDVAVIVALISPYIEIRRYARGLVENFVEVYTKCSIETCIQRNTKGLYKKALNCEITDFAEVQEPCEEPENPELVLDTEKQKPEENVERILLILRELELIG
ncbi:MAG: adenylyl-sulfate kinase [Nitrososphaerales archaeon]|nr:adenylyl-sulfate kinase [Nitrososphaerales archaeon]